jgi:hypothetical protein
MSKLKACVGNISVQVYGNISVHLYGNISVHVYQNISEQVYRIQAEHNASFKTQCQWKAVNI